MASIHKENPTQRQQIINYLKSKDTPDYISAYEAFSELFISQFWARIFELEKLGWQFSRERVKYTSPSGIRKDFIRVRIAKEGTEV